MTEQFDPAQHYVMPQRYFEDFEVGEEVWAKDEGTGEEGCCPVTDVHQYTVSWAFELTVKDLETDQQDTVVSIISFSRTRIRQRHGISGANVH